MKLCQRRKSAVRFGKHTRIATKVEGRGALYSNLKSKNMIKLLTECIGILWGLGLISVI